MDALITLDGAEPPADRRRPALRQYGLAVGLAVFALLCRAALDGMLGSRGPYLFLLPAIIVAAVFGGLGPGIVCLLLCAGGALYLWLPPLDSLDPGTRADWTGFAVFLGVSVLMVVLGRAQRIARRRAYLAGLAFLQSERRTKDILESISDGFCALDRDGRYEYINAAAEAYFGRPRGSLLGRPAWEAFPGGVGALLEERCRRAMIEDVAVHFDSRSPTSGRWLDISAYPSGEGLSVYFRDVTDRKRVEQEKAVLLARERLARERAVRLQRVTASFSRAVTVREVADLALRLGREALMATQGALFLIADAGGLELLDASGMNDAARERWARIASGSGVPMNDAIRDGHPVVVESRDDWARRYPDHPAEGLHGGTSASIPLVIPGRSLGCLTFGFAEWRPVDEEERAFMVALAQQCVQALERARLFELQETARADAEAANRLKDEFLATVSHELRTPLNAIVGWARVVCESPRDDAVVNRAVELIQRNAQAQERLISDILDVSRIVTGKLGLETRAVDPTLPVEAAVEAVRPAAETKGIVLQATFETPCSIVQGDPDRLQQQIAWNLVSNAVKFTPAGGRVDVRLARRGSAVELVVQDTGEGIAPDFLPFVFDRFRQADSTSRRRHGGIGLGLALVRHLVELHGGSVEAASAGPGRGAMFTVRLPPTTLPSAARPPLPKHRGPDATIPIDIPRLDGLKVLVVEDHADAREGLALFLRLRGAHVDTAANVPEALRAFHHSVPSVLVADIGMPGEDGYALIDKVRSLPEGEGGRVPALALTGYAREQDRAAALAAGFDAHVPKPVDGADLAAAIARLCAPRTSPPPLSAGGGPRSKRDRA